MVESGVRAALSGANSTALDDYLKVIYSHTEWQPNAITPSQLASRLGLAPSSVTEMVKKLAAAGYVEHRPYSAITLTPQGEARALRMLRRHRLIETWLVRVHGYGWDEVDSEAEVLEHAISDRLLAAIDAELGYPTRDPHGDLIPSDTGALTRPVAVRLDAAPIGFVGTVVRISDRDPNTLRALDGFGIALDTALRVAGSEPAGLAITVGDRSVLLAPSPMAKAIWVEGGSQG
jgi:DtxR family transcriptional regulator, Mn-dependent transcriptional regulator